MAWESLSAEVAYEFELMRAMCPNHLEFDYTIQKRLGAWRWGDGAKRKAAMIPKRCTCKRIGKKYAKMCKFCTMRGFK